MSPSLSSSPTQAVAGSPSAASGSTTPPLSSAQQPVRSVLPGMGGIESTDFIELFKPKEANLQPYIDEIILAQVGTPFSPPPCSPLKPPSTHPLSSFPPIQFPSPSPLPPSGPSSSFCSSSSQAHGIQISAIVLKNTTSQAITLRPLSSLRLIVQVR